MLKKQKFPVEWKLVKFLGEINEEEGKRLLQTFEKTKVENLWRKFTLNVRNLKSTLKILSIVNIRLD